MLEISGVPSSGMGGTVTERGPENQTFVFSSVTATRVGDAFQVRTQPITHSIVGQVYRVEFEATISGQTWTGTKRFTRTDIALAPTCTFIVSGTKQ